MQHQVCSRPVSLLCVAASDDTALLVQWETHLLPLKQAGLLTFWSEQHLQAGADRMAQCLTHLDQADCIVLLMSADFFANEACLVAMQYALLRQQANTVVVIPLLLRPIEWQDSDLNPLVYLPTNGIPITRWPDPDEAFHVCLRELRALLHLPSRPIRVPTHRQVRTNKNRERMLHRLRRSYRDLLDQSLQDMAWQELGLTEKPDAVQNVTNFDLRIGRQSDRALPPGVTITQVYEEAEQELLILGQPGAGKSTQLLHLAQYLVAQAEQDEDTLLPVILPLSSWATKQGALEGWMTEQIALTYDIPRKVSQQWVSQERILPLLDGLDEMEEVARQVCITAINAYHCAHLTPLVVCSRTEEYQSASNKQRLLLQNAVIIQPLTHKQVGAVLDQGGERIAGLQTALQGQPELQTLATNPLMLSVLLLTYQRATACTHLLHGVDLEQQIWKEYVQRMVERKSYEDQYSLEQIRTWLAWLAQQMSSHNQSIFYGEHLQADWLPPGLQQFSIWLALRLPAILLGAFLCPLVWMFLGNGHDPTTLLQLGLLGGYLGGWLARFSTNQCVSQTKSPLGKKHSSGFLVHFGIALVLGVLVAASFGLYMTGLGLYTAGIALTWSQYALGDWLRDGCIYGIGIGLGGWLLPWPLLRVSRSFPVGWFNSIHLHRAIVIALVWGTAYGLSSGLSRALYDGGFNPSDIWLNLSDSLGRGLSSSLSNGLIFGFVGFLLSAILDNRGGTFRLAERLSWNGQSLIRLGHLRNTVLVACALFLIPGLSQGLADGLNTLELNYGLSSGLNIGLTDGLAFGLAYWLFFGLYQGIVQEQIKDQDRYSFNQGIRRSLRNGIFISLLGGGIAAGIGILTIGQNDWFLAVSCGLLIWATIGGLTVLQHYVVRLLLARSHTFPWRAQTFLAEAATLLLLRRAGGGYSFVHRRLLDYFASLDTLSMTAKETH